jgi:hypothetical protein
MYMIWVTPNLEFAWYMTIENTISVALELV